jgi:mycothiol synthase
MTLRAPRGHEEIFELFERTAAAYQEPYFDADELRLWLTSPRVDLERDARVADKDDRVVSYVDVDPVGEEPVRWWCDVRVDPEANVRPLVEELLEWAEARTGEGVIRLWVPEVLEDVASAYTDAGYRRIRASYRMEIELTHDVPRPQFPDRITVRTLEPGQERVAYEVHDETFRDSWEHTTEPYEEWAHFLLDPAFFDPSLWFIAWDGDTPAGLALCRERYGLGWVGILGVRRGWRQRGLGRALLQHAFHEFRRRGFQRAGLGVDAESLTGANRLYESAGMRVARQLDFYEKQLPSVA